LTHTLEELAQYVNAKIKGDASVSICGISTLESGQNGDITFLSNPKYKKHLEITQASAVILAPDQASLCPTNALIVTNPYLAYARISALLNPPREYTEAVHASAVVGDNCQFGNNVHIGPHVTLGNNISIGDNSVVLANCAIDDDCIIGSDTTIYANVSIYAKTEIGNRTILHSGVVVGSDGYGIANDKGKWLKVPQIGKVVIGDDVEIGANTTVDRGAINDTIIKNGVKLDNQIQIAHNVVIGEDTAIAGCAGVAGSVTIGARCAIGGGVGIAGHIEIADDVQITAMSLVTRSITSAGVYSSGTPLQENKTWHRNFVRFTQLDDMAKRLKKLEKKIEHL